MRNSPRLFSRYTFVFSSGLGLVAATNTALAQPAEDNPDALAPPEEEVDQEAEALPDEGSLDEPEPTETPRASQGSATTGRVEPPPAGPSPTPTEVNATVDTSEAELAAEAESEEEPKSNGPESTAVTTFPVTTGESWFTRQAWVAKAGKGQNQLSMTFYGFLQFDTIYDTTRSFPEDIGPRLVARTDTYEGNTGRLVFTAKNTRVGMRLQAPEIARVTPTLVIEGDFFGNQPGQPHDESETTEVAFYDSPTFRLRHGFVHLANPIADLTFGQTYDLFAWQNYFYPATAEFLGIPSMAFSRPLQVKAVREFGRNGPIGVDVGLAAVRPVQRDGEVPDLRAGVRFKVNKFRGLSVPGNGDPFHRALALGVSGTTRQLKVDAFTPPPTQSSNAVTAWGLSIDALVPVIPVKSTHDRANALTLTGAFVMGTGIGDLMAATGGARFPTLPNAAQSNPPPLYHGNIDPGIATFDSQGVLNTIDWQGFRAGVQYFLPPSGRVMVALNYSQAHSANMADLFPRGGAEIELLGRVADAQRYMDASLFWDATNALKFGLHGSYMTARYLDGDEPYNIRGRAQVLYFF